ncbi:MAG: FAD-dependent oxidoreductase [Microbacteriaceae bacterium]|nr:FAD-dependent oxidoreductase [Microbacteriaceae bacterium]
MEKLRLAVVGAGPAGIYASDLILKAERDFEVSIDLFDLLPTPYGLVRYGVAPDHPRIKGIVNALFDVLDRGDIRFFGNVEYGKDITLEELKNHYNAVIFATGAIRDADLNIPGIDLAGSYGAADFVNWYDAHPDFPREWPLDAKEVAVVGNGNVALDVARMLVKFPDDLSSTEIPPHVEKGLRQSQVTDVHVFGRRGPAQAKFSPLELREAIAVEGVQSIVYDEDFVYDEGSSKQMEENNQTRVVVKTLEGLRENPQPESTRRLHLHFLSTPEEIIGEGKVQGIRIRRNQLDGNGGATPTDETREFPVQAVYRAVGYHGSALPGIPFDEKSGVISNDGGRVIDDAGEQVQGVYATGWIKRGPVGLIGHTKADAIETIGHVLSEKHNWWKPSHPEENAVIELLQSKGVKFVSWDGWLRENSEELRRGESSGREREKLFDRDEMVKIANS